MRLSICLLVLLLAASRLNAETYSWVDDAGTYNFTEDYYSIPLKYRNKLEQRGDSGRSETVKPSSVQDKPTEKTVESPQKSKAAAGGGAKLYSGKTWEAWNKELEVQAGELKELALRMEQLWKQYETSPGLAGDKIVAIKKEHDETRVKYDKKLIIYNETVEAARKAGLKVETTQ